MYSKQSRHADVGKRGTALPLFLVCLCWLALISGCSAQSAPPLPVKGGLEVIGGNSYDFGEQPQKTELYNEFTLVNNSSVPIRFTGIQSSCGCTWAQDNDKIVGSRLGPNDYLDFIVFLSTGSQQTAASGKIRLDYRHETDDPNLAFEGKLILQVEATILPDYRMEPLELDFGEINGLDVQKVQKRLRITPEQLKSLVVDEIRPSIDVLTINIVSMDDNVYEAEVTLDVSSFTENRDLRGHLVVSTNSEAVPKGIVRVKAKYVAPVNVQPSAIIISSDQEGMVEEAILISTSSPSQLIRVDCGAESSVRAEYDSAHKSDRHTIKLIVAPCDDHSDQTIRLELSLFPSSGESVLRSFPVSVYRFKKGD